MAKNLFHLGENNISLSIVSLFMKLLYIMTKLRQI